MSLFKRKNNSKSDSKQRQPTLMAGQDSYSFRRSRTLTGSMSSDVTTVAEKNSQLQSPRLKTHQLHRYRQGIIATLTISLVVIAGLSWIVGQFIIVPNDFTYTQQLNAQPPSQSYAQTIQKYFKKNPTQQFLFQLDRDGITRSLTEKHPEVKAVLVEKLQFGNFDIAVTLRQPVLSWQSGDKQLYVDDSGTAFKDNYFLEPKVSVEDQSGIKIDNANSVASGRFIRFLGQIVSGINTSGLVITKIIIPTGTTREVDLQLDQRRYLVKTHIDRDPAVQAQDVINAVRYLEGKGITPLYLDARVAGKAYYKEE